LCDVHWVKFQYWNLIELLWHFSNTRGYFCLLCPSFFLLHTYYTLLSSFPPDLLESNLFIFLLL
jgi:hypothetical protein